MSQNPRPTRRTPVGVPPLPKKFTPPPPPAASEAPQTSVLTEQAKKVFRLALKKKK